MLLSLLLRVQQSKLPRLAFGFSFMALFAFFANTDASSADSTRFDLPLVTSQALLAAMAKHGVSTDGFISEVVVTGGSAGGLSTTLHVDEIQVFEIF